MTVPPPVSIAAIGVGNRTRKYLQYVTAHPESARLAAIVECDPKRLAEAREEYGLEEGACFRTAEEFFCRKRQVEAVIIGTPDSRHYEQCMAAIARGYHVLLEKPAARTMAQCLEIDRAAERAGVKVAVCYVLRLHPYYLKLREILHSGRLGRLLSMHHTVNVGIDRMTHTYVRGPWGVEEESTSIFLSKCCHDVDILLWLADSRPRRVVSFGALSWFRPENAPAGSSDRCLTCAVEEGCPFSAVDLYRKRKRWTDNFFAWDHQSKEQVIEEELRTGRYGRCVFRCGNDVMDNQTVLFDTLNGVNASIRMVSMTREDSRCLRLNCAYGEVVADDDRITVSYFHKDRKEVYDFEAVNRLPLHGNADLALVEDFLGAVRDEGRQVKCPLHTAIDSHLLCFKAEESRISGEVRTVCDG